MSTDKPRLGRGLEALLNSSRVAARQPAADTPRESSATAGLRTLALSAIRPNPMQPRKEFREDELADLEASLRVNGLLQPINVRPAPNGVGFELIAGERRFRAAQRLGWKEIPALVKDIDDRTLLTLAMIENLQRSDLNPIEEAEGYQRLMSDFSLSQQEVADVVGKDRSTIANMLRLLALPVAVRKLVRDGALSIGHARALLGLGDAHRIAELAKVVIAEELSVRQVEQRVREAAPGKGRATKATTAATDTRSAEVRRLEGELRKALQTDVRIDADRDHKGEVRISFYSADDLERVLDVILGARRDAL
ncbi:MAG: ParB/RepB/Spo0J family partition protein [Gemmatimonadaceae bacterium]|nr:ParB/RepB/Spo0J family partition protein [Gemmatimonadaceae bacterium]